MQKISVLGCGRWGSFIAWYLATKKGKEVWSWGPEEDYSYQVLKNTGKNEYVTLDKSITLTCDLAAAVARDANARTVMLMGRGVSGSVRSRAVRAGIDAVIDLDEVGDLPAGGAANDGGRLARPPALAAPPVEVPLDADIPGAPIVTFCSGRGGVGKTALVATAAAMAARWGMSVCALDLDLSCGDLFSCFGLPGGSDLARLASELAAGRSQ